MPLRTHWDSIQLSWLSPFDTSLVFRTPSQRLTLSSIFLYSEDISPKPLRAFSWTVHLRPYTFLQRPPSSTHRLRHSNTSSFLSITRHRRGQEWECAHDKEFCWKKQNTLKGLSKRNASKSSHWWNSFCTGKADIAESTNQPISTTTSHNIASVHFICLQTRNSQAGYMYPENQNFYTGMLERFFFPLKCFNSLPL